ncbi:protein fam63a [Phtheirospermum japonicum]|uniref:Protein fam63a n=1 Tax=Phtheirospermum japonicum TaxID=374723 RepID=A0A830CFE1_9LAMI|nr:protein fam63a [Phtheirospermum japonicum]
MDSSPISPPQSASTSVAAAPPPPAEVEAKREERTKEMLHRTKLIQFLGRKAPIILQNDNGPCPLLAICNVLSLKNSLNLSPDISEVSQEKLLSLNKDTGYVENQQQNIADAIDLLPRLTTGIDVNIKFRRIDDFEFTRECAIFDLMDIPLYHGWIVDPQDLETADAIGSKSYNSLMGDLVSLETKTMESEQKNNPEDDGVDFVAATTAALGVPSPSLSRGQSFDESPHRARKGDIEEEAELLRILELSGAETSSLTDSAVADVNLHESAYVKKPELVTNLETVESKVTDETVKSGTLIFDDCNALNGHHVNLKLSEVVSQIDIDPENGRTQTACEESRKHVVVSDASNNSQDKSRIDERDHNESTITSDKDEPRNHQNARGERDTSSLLNTSADSDLTSGLMHHINEREAFSSSVDSSEPIYEGEERILDSGTVVYENREPVYEGEVVLAEQVDKGSLDDSGLNSKEISVKQGEIIRNFMKNSASQLTVYGLFCLQDKVKERELCVFFRNNHFNTMFKYEGELYILATDQGFINQPDLVWEKLNEVNGDTVYMTSNFKEFKMEDHSNSTWDEQNVMASTADYLASIDNSQENSSFNSDLQLAIALQQQEFDQQQEQQPQRNTQQPQPQPQPQPAPSIGSRLVTGPQPKFIINGGKSCYSLQAGRRTRVM